MDRALGWEFMESRWFTLSFLFIIFILSQGILTQMKLLTTQGKELENTISKVKKEENSIDLATEKYHQNGVKSKFYRHSNLLAGQQKVNTLPAKKAEQLKTYTQVILL